MSGELASPVSDETVLELIHEELVDAGVEPEEVTPDARLDDLDIDSLDVTQILTTIKKRYGVVIPREELDGVTVGDLAGRVSAATAS